MHEHRPLNSPSPELLGWLAALVKGKGEQWPPYGAARPADLVRLACSEGVVAMASWRAASPALQALNLPPELLQQLKRASNDEVLASMLFEAETKRVLACAAELDIPVLLLKGSALCHWAFTSPHLRECSDVDVLVPLRESAEILAQALAGQGLEYLKPSGDLVAYELMCRRRLAEGWNLEVDIHWRLTNSALFAECFTFDELWASCIVLDRLAPNARGLGPVEACIHSCLHRVLNLSIGGKDTLKWLYDLETLMQGFSMHDWETMADLAGSKRVAGPVLSGLEAACQVFGGCLPVSLAQKLRVFAVRESLDVRRLSDWRYMQGLTLNSLSPLHRAKWLWQRIFPSLDYLRLRYDRPHAGYSRLLVIRAINLRKRVSSGQ